jgi:hypothetical protein
MRLMTNLGRLGWITALIVIVGAATEPLHVRQEFYAIVAQVLPVFLLVVAVEGRFFFERPVYGPFRRYLGNQTLVLALLGEVFALIAVARGTATAMERGGVLIALGILGFQFMTFASFGPAAAPAEMASGEPSR